jgi:predicted RNA-binding Zn-ribbon protein involved in translation (DUF1610 family)
MLIFALYRRYRARMEREQPTAKRAVIRAVRSLAINSEKAVVIYRRIERAEERIRGYLLANGLASANLGGYQVDLEGEEIRLIPLPPPDAKQLPLPNPPAGGVIHPQVENVATREEAELIERARAGELPCPKCGKPLGADQVMIEQMSRVLLWCPDTEKCGFREF